MGIIFSWSLFPESEILFYLSLGLSAFILSGLSGIAHESKGSKAYKEGWGLKCLLNTVFFFFLQTFARLEDQHETLINFRFFLYSIMNILYMGNFGVAWNTPAVNLLVYVCQQQY